MTIRDRLISMLGFTADKNSIDGVLLDAGLNGTVDYQSSYLQQVRLCAISVLELLLSTPDQKNDTGFDIKYDRRAVEVRLNLLKAESGLIVDTAVKLPTLKNKSYLW